jgi:integrase
MIADDKTKNIPAKQKRQPAQTFRNFKEAMSIRPPEMKPCLEALHHKDSHFGIRVMRPRKKTKHVTRTWFVRLGDDRKKLGDVEFLKYEQAHLEADAKFLAYRKKVRAGVTALNETLQEAYDAYKLETSSEWSPVTVDNYESSWAHLAPVVSEQLDMLTTAGLTKVFADIRKGVVDRNLARESPIAGYNGSATVKRIARLLNAVLNYAIERGSIDRSPLRPLVRRGLLECDARRAFAIPRGRLSDFWSWLNSTDSGTRDYILIVLFLALRRSVVGCLRWSQLDTTNWTLRVPADTRGNKARVEFAHPIPDWLVENVFKPRLQSSTKHPDWIIESNKRVGCPRTSVRGSLEAFGTRTGVRVHDHAIRRTSSTLLHASGTASTIVIGRLLTHNQQAAPDREATLSGYVVGDTEEFRAVLNRMVDYTLELVKTGMASPQAELAYDKAKDEDQLKAPQAADLATLDDLLDDDEEAEGDE